MSSREIPVLGMDPSLRNWGLSFGYYNLDTKQIRIADLDVINPAVPKGKQVRQNSKDIEAAKQITTNVVGRMKQAKVTFVEVPVGSQSARAMASYALCVGVLGALRAGGLQFIELTPSEIKVAATGNPEAKKKEMIQWATTKHPDAPWPTYKQHGKELITEGTAEHMADATAAIHAGVNSDQFQQLIALL